MAGFWIKTASGVPTVYGRDDALEYLKGSDAHGVVGGPDGVLKINDKLRLVPGHRDPTCNVHDWYEGVRRRFMVLNRGLTEKALPWG